MFLAADYLDNTNYENKVARVFKRAANGSWSLFAPASGAYTGRHPAIVNDPAGELHLIYSVTPNGSGTMDLMYRKYNSSGTETAAQKLLSAPIVYTPQLGFAPNSAAPAGVIPVVQFVSGNGTDYRIWQTSQLAAAIWSAPTASITSGNQAVFLHTVSSITGDQPDMLWYDNLNKKVYFNRAPDKIAAWQPPAAPVVKWADQGLNSGNTQKVSASVTVLPAGSTQVFYDWEGAGLSDTAYSANTVDTKSDVSDRQKIKARIMAKDAAGNESLYSPYSAEITIPDRTRPAGTIQISGGADYTNTINVTLLLTYNDTTPDGTNQSGMKDVSLNGTTLTGWQALGGSKTVNLNSLLNGQRTVEAIYRDVSLNTSVAAADTIYLDTVTPAITSGALVTSSSVANPVFNWTADDPPSNSYASGVKEYRVYWGNDSGGTDTAAQTGASYSPAAITVQDTYYLRVQPLDNAGNTGNWFTVAEYTYDTSGPTAAGVTINNGAAYTNTTGVTLTLKATGAVSMNISNTSAQSGSWVAYAESNNYSWILDTGADGLRTVYVWYRDAAGNETRVTDDIILDTVGPTAAGVTINNGAAYTSTTAVTLTLKATDAVSMNISNSNTQGSWVDYAEYNNNYSWALAGGADGVRTVYVWYRDAAGNETQVTDTIILDTAGPTAAGVTINNGAAYTGTTGVTLTLKATGAVSMNISNSSTPGSWVDYAEYNNNYSWALAVGADGVRTVYVWYRDAAGNETRVTDDIILDTVGPTAAGVTINNGADYTNMTGVILTLKAAGAVSMNISNSSTPGSWVDYVEYNNNYPWTLAVGADGLRTVYVWYRDAAGNETRVTDDITLDTAGPVITGSDHGVTINSGAEWTNTLNVALTIKATDTNGVTSMNISNTQNVPGQWYPYSAAYPDWLLVDDGQVTKTVYVIFQDAAGNTSNAVTDDIKYDGQSPSGGGTGGSSGYGVTINNGAEWTNTLSVTLHLKATDNVGIVSMNISNTPNTLGLWYAYDETYLNWPLVDDGNVTKTVYVLFQDAAGNTSNVVTDDIKYNNTRPTGDVITGTGKYGLVINNDAEWTKVLNVTLNISASSNVGAIASMNISNDSGFGTGSGWIAYNTTYNNWPLLSTGDPVTKTVYIQFRDAAGNTSDVFSDDIKFDEAVPTASGPDGSGGSYGVTINNGDLWTTSLTVSLSLKATDNIGVTSMNISNTPNIWGQWLKYEETFANWLLADNGQVTKTVYVKFRDAAGNESGAVTDCIQYDVTGPNFPPAGGGSAGGGVLINNGAVYTNTTNVSLTFPATGADEMRVSNDIAFTGSLWETYRTAMAAWLLQDTEGVQTVNVQYRDLAGNTSNIGYDTIILDRTPPGGLVTINGGAASSNSLVLSLTLTASDNLSGVAEMLISETSSASGVWQAYKTAASYKFSDKTTGNRTIYVWYKDRAGNISLAATDDIMLLETDDDTPGDGGTGEDIWLYPNPFSPAEDEEGKIGFLTDRDGWHRVYIYNIRGERIWSAETYARAGETNIVVWNGRALRGQTAPNGIYILLLVNDSKKIIGRGRLTLLD
ncbi:MAG: hypothetical protein LBQ83_03955 [Candidatus Margulisbacteria bacterium]|nr:hypothetical protein [Candidatus Margulisiibacteriota bacterium]